MKIYTKKGDHGTTSLTGGERVSKFDERVEAYGTVDELMANIALLRDSMDESKLEFTAFRADLAIVINELMTVAAILSEGDNAKGKTPDISQAKIILLEKRIDEITATLKPITSFTLPGGNPLVSMSHVCRTVCRRAERAADKAASLHTLSPAPLTYLNRLSDYLYTLGRSLSEILNVKELYWVLEK